jgi:MFS family permease
LFVAEVQPPTTDKLDFKRVFPIFIIIFVDLMGLTIVIPILQLYAASFGATPFLLGALQASYPLMQFLGAPLLGGLSDRYGRRPVLLISQVGTFIGFLLMGVAGSLPMLFLSRMIPGLAGANIATAQAALSDSSSSRNRAQALGLVGAAFGLGFILGPVIALVALSVTDNDYRAPAFIAAGFSLLSIILTTLIFPETLPPERRNPSAPTGLRALTSIFPRMVNALRSPEVGILLALMFFQQAAFGAFTTFFTPLTLTRLGMGGSANAVFFTFIGLVIVVVQGQLIGPLSSRFGERRLIYAGLASLAIGLTLLCFTPTQPPPTYSRERVLREISGNQNAPVGESIAVDVSIDPPPDDVQRGYFGIGYLIFSLLFTSIGTALLQPSINSLITKRVDPRQVGGTLGLSAAYLSAANTTGPLVGGVVAQTFGTAATFLFGGLIVAVLFLIARQRIKPGAEEVLQAVPQVEH